jgi:predicted RNA polymerase sigma factor
VAKFLDSEWTLAATVDEAFDEHGIRDDQLRMIFMCCHPTNTLDWYPWIDRIAPGGIRR